MRDKRESIPFLTLTGICLALALATFPLLGKIPGWTILALHAALGARWYYLPRAGKMPPVWLKLLLLAIAVGGVAATHGTLLGPEAGLSILLVLIALKVLESESGRDFQVLALVGFFLCLCGLFFTQELVQWLYVAGIAAFIVWMLVLFHRGGNGPGRSARITGTMLAQAIPVAVLLFVVFPRGGVGFRFQFGRAILGNQGISDRLEPGSFASLMRSETVVLRAEFPDGTIPSAPDMYWRGAVLWHCGGLSWTRGRPLPREVRKGQLGGAPIRQRISLQPHGERWIFALDRPSSDVRNASAQPGGFLQSDRPVTNTFIYTVESQPENRETRLPLDHVEAGLALPADLSPAVRTLAASWTAQAQQPREIVSAALRHFRTERFTYTLEPGTYGENALDEFLFERRAGFCEHYAAAFATLMRAAGLPSRIVVGYHGGQYNAVGHYVIVRQYHAHAWCEVWLQGRGWMRVDPTEAIAPERVSGGLSLSRSGASDGRDFLGDGGSGAGSWWRAAQGQMSLAWDSINYRWDLHVQSFDEEQQRTLLALLRLPRLGSLGLLLWSALAVVVVLGLIGAWLRWPARMGADPIARAYGQLCQRLAAAGVKRDAWEGPLTFTERAALALPEHAGALRRCGQLYATLRYARTPPAARDFTRAVRRLPRLSRTGTRASMPAPR